MNSFSQWRDVIDDLADGDEFRVNVLQPWRAQQGTCEACGNKLTHMSYAVHVELPFGIDSYGDERWHYFADVCWDCMVTVVAAGGHPTPWGAADHQPSQADLEARLDAYIRETYRDKNDRS